MKSKFFKKAISFCIVLSLLLIPVCPNMNAQAASQDINLNFGKSKLAQMDNAENLILAYEEIYNAIDQKLSCANIYEYGLTDAEADMVFTLYRGDNGEHFWLGSSYSMSYVNFIVEKINFTYEDDFDIEKYNEKFQEYLGLVSPKQSEYKKALILHDALVKNIVYEECDHSHTSYGALVCKKAVCEGYAKAYQALLEKSGIMSYIVTGTGGGEAHAWNLVRLDGKFYYTDVTWDDPKLKNTDEETKPVFYSYFNMPQKYFGAHLPDDDYNILPECTSDDKMYKNYTKIHDCEIDEIANAFNYSNCDYVARLFFENDEKPGEDTSNWIKSNLQFVFSKLPINKFSSASYIFLENEIYISFSDVRDEPVKKGDLTDNGKLAIEDAIFLLYSISFPSDFKKNQDCDFNKDEKTSIDDAIYLLYSISFSQQFPL